MRLPKHTPPHAPPSWKCEIRVGSWPLSVECLCTTDVVPAPCTASFKVSFLNPLYMANNVVNPHTLRMEPQPHSRRPERGRVRRGEGLGCTRGWRRETKSPLSISSLDGRHLPTWQATSPTWTRGFYKRLQYVLEVIFCSMQPNKWLKYSRKLPYTLYD